VLLVEELQEKIAEQQGKPPLINAPVAVEIRAEYPPPKRAALEHAVGVLEGRWKMMILAHPFGETVMRFSARDSKSVAEDAGPAVAQSRKGRCHHPHCSPTGSAEGRIHADRLMTAFSGLPRPGLTRFSQRGMMGCEHRSRPLFGTPGAVKS
jgi:hypothetical protein